MRIVFDRARARALFGSLSVSPNAAELAAAPFGIAQGIIPPGTVTHPHRHLEAELFTVMAGRGWFITPSGRIELSISDAVYASPMSLHYFENASLQDELVILKFWWEDKMQFAEKMDDELARLAHCADNVIVTATPPTPNGDLHVGHLSGPYLRADAYTRFLKLKGRNAHYITGIDDHQSYVALKAERSNQSPQDAANELGALMISSLQKAGIEPDWIGEPRRSPTHIPLARQMMHTLHAKGHLIAKDTPAPYCESCDEFIFEAYVSGHCPHCSTPSGGNACEVCGRPNDCADLQKSRCNRCGAQPVIRSYERLYFPLAPHAQRLTEFWNSVHMSAHLRSLCSRMLAAGLPDIAVSHRTHWGIPVPIEGWQDQKIYVWFEMAAGYLAATQDLSRVRNDENLSRCWHDATTQIVQFFGYDNGYFHAVLFPALWHCFDPEIRLPAAFVTNEFYRLDGKKFSTSRRHAIWGQDFFACVPSDVARLYLAYSGPDVEETNFTYRELTAFATEQLVGEWNGWLTELGAAVERECAGITPSTGTWTNEHIGFYGQLRSIVARAERAYCATTFSLQDAARVLCDLVRIARVFARSEAHWIGLPAEEGVRRTGLVLQLSAARCLAILASPLMPQFSRSLWASLGYSADQWSGSWESAGELIAPGLRVENSAFPRFAPLPETLGNHE